MKISKHLVAMAVLGLSLGMVGCDDDDSDSSDASVSDGSVDSSTADVLVKLDVNTTDGAGDAKKDGSAGDASDAGGSSSSDAGGDAAPGAVACSDYCDKMAANCTAANEQYTNKGDCMSACQNKLAWPQGADNTGNTLACRLYHAKLAATNATTHCPHAGPTGAGQCGTLCENYCYLASKNCTGANALYPDNAACATACMGFAPTGTFGDTTGNTLVCRVYHVNVARDNANLHCPHAGVTPTAFCVPAT